MSEINVVPYIDVMLVLLVIFMVTAPLINPGEIELPEVGSSLKPPSSPIEITLKSDHRLLLRDPGKSSQAMEITREELAQAIREKQSVNPDQAVVIAADRSVRYEDVIKVMDILQQNQVKRVGLLARTKNR